MDHPVVVALWRAAAARGLRALRYDFRGVGRSGGEPTADARRARADLEGALDFLGGGPALAAGYSFGARATLLALREGGPIARAALVALPTRLPANRAAMSNLLLGRPIRTEEYAPSADLDALAQVAAPFRLFAGSNDPLVEPAELRRRGVEPVLLEGLNHFFSRRPGNLPALREDLDRLAAAVLEFLLSFTSDDFHNMP